MSLANFISGADRYGDGKLSQDEYKYGTSDL
jgi:hypothetical protein